MEYTKGEWKADRDNIVWCGEHSIASVLPHFKTEEEYDGNTNLIAAAPNTYEELRKASTTIHNAIRYAEGEYRVALQRQLKEIGQALAKAEGKG